MSEQFEYVNCEIQLENKEKFQDIPEDFVKNRDIEIEEGSVICKDCLEECQRKINRMAVKGSGTIPPEKPK